MFEQGAFWRSAKLEPGKGGLGSRNLSGGAAREPTDIGGFGRPEPRLEDFTTLGKSNEPGGNIVASRSDWILQRISKLAEVPS